jgi:hypothetical protein
MNAIEILNSVQFLVNENGQPSAVQLNMQTWNALLNFIEETEDRAAIKEILPRLRQGPEKAGALRWAEVKAQWND